MKKCYSNLERLGGRIRQMSQSPILKLNETRVWRTYLGGTTLDMFRGREPKESGHFPEDWVASTTRAFNPGREAIVEGLSVVLNKEGQPYLKDILEAEGTAYFGDKHVQALGNEAGMLIKLIDAHERLTIQVHPDKAFAKTYFQSEFGKTESWYILDAQPVDGEAPCIYFGFKPHVTRELFKEIFDRQDIPAMLDCLHKIPVKAGDSFFIPGGLPHAIGAGCFLAEVQEPTDYTIRTERVTPAGLKIHDNLCHQGLGFDKMFDAFHYDGESIEATCAKWKTEANVLIKEGNNEVVTLIDKRHTDLFQMNRITVDTTLDYEISERLRIWLVLEGEGVLKTTDETLTIQKGDYLLLPYDVGKCTVEALKGQLSVIECLPKHIESMC